MWPLGFDLEGVRSFMDSVGLGYIEGADGTRWYADYEVAVRLKMLSRRMTGDFPEPKEQEGEVAWAKQLEATKKLFRMGALEMSKEEITAFLSKAVLEAARKMPSSPQTEEEILDWDLMVRRLRKK